MIAGTQYQNFHALHKILLPIQAQIQAPTITIILLYVHSELQECALTSPLQLSMTEYFLCLIQMLVQRNDSFDKIFTFRRNFHNFFLKLLFSADFKPMLVNLYRGRHWSPTRFPPPRPGSPPAGWVYLPKNFLPPQTIKEW